MVTGYMQGLCNESWSCLGAPSWHSVDGHRLQGTPALAETHGHLPITTILVKRGGEEASSKTWEAVGAGAAGLVALQGSPDGRLLTLVRKGCARAGRVPGAGVNHASVRVANIKGVCWELWIAMGPHMDLVLVCAGPPRRSGVEVTLAGI